MIHAGKRVSMPLIVIQIVAFQKIWFLNLSQFIQVD